MNEYKNIDKLFQDKLQDFEASPRPEVWQNIEEKMQQKKKRRILPMWWFSGGVAAILVLGIFVFPFFTKEPKIETIKNEEIIVEQPRPKVEAEIKSNDVLNTIKEDESEIIVSSERKKDRSKENKYRYQNIEEKVDIIVDKSSTQKEKKKLIIDKKVNKESINYEGFKLVDKNVMEKIFSKKKQNLEKKEVEITIKDDSILNLKPKKDFIVEMAKKDSLQLKKEIKKQWSLAPVVATIKSNFFSGSSPVGNSFKNNEVKGNNTFSYGIKVAYQLNDKWAIQSGVHLQDMSYTTQNVTLISSGFVQNDSSSSISSSDVSIESVSAISSAEGINQGEIINSNAQLQQTLKYIEVPIEIKYTLIRNEKFNTNLITGFSSLILNNNTIEAKATNFSRTLGGASNLNTINFSGNIGLDFNYSFSKKWTLNINPMFKTQLNTFSKDSNGFKPYSIGIYSGFTYKF